jgi:FlaA1/EpsC-like NDP-sugar epimerase
VLKRATSSVAARRLLQLAVDGGLVALAYYLSFALRFDNGTPHRYRDLLGGTIILVVVGKLLIFATFGLYHKLWRFIDQKDFERVVQAALVSTLLVVVAFFLVPGETNPPRGVIALDFLLTLTFISAARFGVRMLLVERSVRMPPERGAREVLIIGGGSGGQAVVSELRRNPGLRSVPIGFVDDDPRKQGMRIGGLKVLGTTSQLARILDAAEPDEVIIAIPSAPGTLRQRVVTACRERQIPVRTLPTVFELLSGGLDLMRQVREVQVEDVLGREPVISEVETAGAWLENEVVLVTGAGGSIGSELSRQIARVRPALIVLVDHAEGNLFEIRRELEYARHFRNIVAVLADCKDATRMREVFLQYRPGVVFHAAAYKHVGLMEENPVAAVQNNAVATRIVARAAADAGAKRFVLVSTDKAVRPATVMGASKAMAEWAAEGLQRRYPGTIFTTVRFGNVLGSSGSVVPIFRRQIAAGGPVTVTDPRMTRYFMTIPESVQLIIRSGSLAKGGEIFVLDMGEPVKIIDLARNMIRLSGQEPDVDIAIEIIGPRPGEKVHEDLFNPDERARPTGAEKIVAAERPPLDADWVDQAFARVEDIVYGGDAASLPATVAELSAERVLAAEQRSPVE